MHAVNYCLELFLASMGKLMAMKCVRVDDTLNLPCYHQMGLSRGLLYMFSLPRSAH
jgi:hypothetical protein